MYCKKCGKLIEDDSVFCRYCGTRMDLPSNGDADQTTTIENASIPNTRKATSKKIMLVIASFVIVALGVLAILIISNRVPDRSVAVNSNNTSVDDSIKEDVVIETIYMTKKNMRPTILETSNIKVQLNSFGYSNNETIYNVHFLVENNTDTELRVLLNNVVVNKFDISSGIGITNVDPGHKRICVSSIWQDQIDKTGKSKWNEITGVVEIWDATRFELLYSVPVVIDKACWEYEEEYAQKNPVAPIISTDLAEIPEDAVVLSCQNLYPKLVNQDGIKVSVASYEYSNGRTMFRINFTVENKASEDIQVTMDAVVDGYDILTYTSGSVVEAGHKAVCDSSFQLSDMEVFGITDWVVIEGTLNVRKLSESEPSYSVPIVIYRDAWTSAD